MTKQMDAETLGNVIIPVAESVNSIAELTDIREIVQASIRISCAIGTGYNVLTRRIIEKLELKSCDDAKHYFHVYGFWPTADLSPDGPMKYFRQKVRDTMLKNEESNPWFQFDYTALIEGKKKQVKIYLHEAVLLKKICDVLQKDAKVLDDRTEKQRLLCKRALEQYQDGKISFPDMVKVFENAAEYGVKTREMKEIALAVKAIRENANKYSWDELRSVWFSVLFNNTAADFFADRAIYRQSIRRTGYRKALYGDSVTIVPDFNNNNNNNNTETRTVVEIPKEYFLRLKNQANAIAGLIATVENLALELESARQSESKSSEVLKDVCSGIRGATGKAKADMKKQELLAIIAEIADIVQ